MRLLRIAAASFAVSGALTASVALAQGGYPGMPGYGAPGPYGAPGMPPGAAPPGYPPGMQGMPGMAPGMPPGAAPQGSTPMADPSQIYGSSSGGQQSQVSSDPSQGYPGSAQGMPMQGTPGMGMAPGMPGMPMAGPMGPNGPMGPSSPMGPNGPMGPSSSMAGMPQATGQSTVNAVPGLPPLANTQSSLPPGSAMGPAGMAAAQGRGPVAGPAGVASMQASPTSQSATPSNQGGVSTDTVHISDTDTGIALDPSPIRYPVNRTITWVNDSSAIIQIASEDGSTFDSGPLAPGDTYTYTPNLIGSVYYRDKLHPWVRGVVVAIQPR